MDYNAPCSISARKFVRSCCRSPENLRFISCQLPAVFPLAITSHYSQWPAGRAPVDGGVMLAYNGKIDSYSQYFRRGFWG